MKLLLRIQIIVLIVISSKVFSQVGNTRDIIVLPDTTFVGNNTREF